MKPKTIHHSYQDIRDESSSEFQHMKMINHFQHKFNRRIVFRQTPKEKAELARRIQAYPTRNHAPFNPLK